MRTKITLKLTGVVKQFGRVTAVNNVSMELRRHEVLGMQTLSATFPLRGGVEALRENLHRLRSEAERAAAESTRSSRRAASSTEST